jgi:hypothetical protein
MVEMSLLIFFRSRTCRHMKDIQRQHWVDLMKAYGPCTDQAVHLLGRDKIHMH